MVGEDAFSSSSPFGRGRTTKGAPVALETLEGKAVLKEGNPLVS